MPFAFIDNAVQAVAEPVTTAWTGYWYEVIVFVSVFGALGGMLGVFKDFDIGSIMRGGDVEYIKSKSHLFAALGIGAASGSGGAIAVLMALVVDGKFDKPPGDRERLLLCSLGMVAGFIGFRVLTHLARGLEEKLDRASHKVETLEEQVKEQEFETALALGFSAANKAAGGDPQPLANQRAASTLARALKIYPTNREIGIILGRLHRWSGKLDEAAEVLTTVIDARGAAGMAGDTDLAALLYNRACYYSLRFGETHNPGHKDLSIKDLSQSVKLDPKNAIEAKSDSDFAPLLEEAAFRSLAGLN